MNQPMPPIEDTTESRFFAEYDRMKGDLAHARQEILLISNQLRDANIETEKLAYKCDFLTQEVARVTASREQYERIAIRVSGKMDAALDALAATVDGIRDEIREAAFTKVPTVAPAGTAEAAGIDVERIGEKFGAGRETDQRLPRPNIGGPHA